MQTFMPHTDSFERIARELDNKRLHKQTLEGWQVLLALTELDPSNNHRDPKGWVNHPVAHMWRGHETLLVSYLTATYYEWIGRGFKSSMLPKIFSTYNHAVSTGRIDDSLTLPGWMSDTEKFEQVASSHRIALLCKDYAWYSQFSWPEDTGARPSFYQYMWPDKESNLYLGTYNEAA